MTTTDTRLIDAVNAILPHLEGFAVEFNYDYSARLSRADGLAVTLFSGGQKERVEITAAPPRFEGNYRSLRDWGVVGYGEGHGPTATFAITRDPKQAARVIAKIVAAYEPLYAKILEKLAAETAHHDAIEVTTKAVASLVGYTLRDRDHGRGKESHFYLPSAFTNAGIGGNVTVTYGGNVTVKLESMNPTTAMAVLKFLKGFAAV